MSLPTEHLRPEREWDGQRFVRSIAEEATWVEDPCRCVLEWVAVGEFIDIMSVVVP